MFTNLQDYGMRWYDPEGSVRFLSVDPLSDKFPMLAPYQYASLNPISNIDLDGLEGVPSFSHEVFKYMKFTTADAKRNEENVRRGFVKAGRISQDVLIISGGVLSIAASGGAILPILTGTVSFATGSKKLYHDLKNEYSSSDATPTTISGTVMVTVNVLVGEEVFSENFVATISIVEELYFLKPKKSFQEMNFVDKLNLLNGSEVVSVDIISLSKNADEIMMSIKSFTDINVNYKTGSFDERNVLPSDKTRVKEKLITPEIKKLEESNKKVEE